MYRSQTFISLIHIFSLAKVIFCEYKKVLPKLVIMQFVTGIPNILLCSYILKDQPFLAKNSYEI